MTHEEADSRTPIGKAKIYLLRFANGESLGSSEISPGGVETYEDLEASVLLEQISGNFGLGHDRVVLVRPGVDLRAANLRAADLSGANLRAANLRYAELSYADLSAADLSTADLSGADLSKTCLHYANLSHSSLCQADLSDADLSKTCLRGANLTGANLTGANLTEAVLDGCVWGLTTKWPVDFVPHSAK